MTKQGKKMKKYLLPFLALATLALAVACEKDSDESVTPPQNPEQPTEGVFSPQRRIASIWVDGAASEQWVWENNLLQRVEVPNDEGSFVPASSFSYDASSRFSTATVTDSMFGSMVVNYSYQGSLLQSLDVNVMGMSAVTANVQHSGDKATHVDLEINSAVLQLLASLLGGGGGEELPARGASPMVDLLSDLLTPQGLRGMMRCVPQHASASKLAIEGIGCTIDFSWEGDNMVQARIAANLQGTVTAAELSNLIELVSTFVDLDGLSSIGTIIEMFGEETVLPITLGVGDTIDLTYDNKPNPFHGFIARLDPMVLSANNVLTHTSRGSLSGSISADVPILGTQTYPFSFALPASSSTFVYTYATDGYPTQVNSTDEDGEVSTSEYRYAE